MNLSGSLSAFGLPDVFALLAMTSKSGALRVRRADPGEPARCGVVRFRQGRITAASPDEGRQVLVRRLVGAGLVDDDALLDAVQAARQGAAGVARTLLESGRVPGDVLRRQAGDQLVDGVFDLLRWGDGVFEFVLDESDPDDVDVSVTVDEVVAQARAREDEWAQILHVVPTADAVLTAPVRLDQDPSLTADEWALLVLVDGRRAIRDLVELTGRGVFEVMATAAALVRRGLVVVRSGGEADHAGVVQRRLALLAPVETAATGPTAAGGPGVAGGPVAGGRGIGPADLLVGTRIPDTPAELVAGLGVAGAAAHAPRVATATREDVVPRVVGATAVAAEADPDGVGQVVGRDPAVNRSLLLRLIAGVKGL